MIKDEMKANILHAVFINSNFISNEKDCNYEKYLLELINNSIYFREKSNFIKYESPKTESHGECDCISPAYQMDFKLLASTSRLHALKELSGQIQNICKGVISHCAPHKPDTKMTATRLHAALREYSCDDLYNFLSVNYEYGTIENDIKTFVKLFNTKKSLFLYFPFQFTFKTHYNFKYAIENVNIALESDFKESNIFREKYCSNYDTFIAFIYEDNLIVSKFEKNGKQKIVDVIFLFKSEIYNKLNEYIMV